MSVKFIVDYNVGKLVKWLRMMGYDTVLFTGSNDRQMVHTAMTEGRIILTRDTQVMNFQPVTSGKVKEVYITSEDPEAQIKQTVAALRLDTKMGLFSRCLECNQPLIPMAKDKVREHVPRGVFTTQNEFVGCPACHRVYWKGSHWKHMAGKLERMRGRIESPTAHT